jgi:hypothetical protein
MSPSAVFSIESASSVDVVKVGLSLSTVFILQFNLIGAFAALHQSLFTYHS